MKTPVVRKSLKARDLPADWEERSAFDPNEEITVWIEPTDPELAAAASLRALMDVIGKRAQERGLTEETLAAILDDR